MTSTLLLPKKGAGKTNLKKNEWINKWPTWKRLQTVKEFSSLSNNTVHVKQARSGRVVKSAEKKLFKENQIINLKKAKSLFFYKKNPLLPNNFFCRKVTSWYPQGSGSRRSLACDTWKRLWKRHKTFFLFPKTWIKKSFLPSCPEPIGKNS